MSRAERIPDGDPLGAVGCLRCQLVRRKSKGRRAGDRGRWCCLIGLGEHGLFDVESLGIVLLDESSIIDRLVQGICEVQALHRRGAVPVTGHREVGLDLGTPPPFGTVSWVEGGDRHQSDVVARTPEALAAYQTSSPFTH